MYVSPTTLHKHTVIYIPGTILLRRLLFDRHVDSTPPPSPRLYSCHPTVPARRNLLGRDPGHGLSTASRRLSMSTSVTYTNPAVLEFNNSCADQNKQENVCMCITCTRKMNGHTTVVPYSSTVRLPYGSSKKSGSTGPPQHDYTVHDHHYLLLS